MIEQIGLHGTYFLDHYEDTVLDENGEMISYGKVTRDIISNNKVVFGGRALAISRFMGFTPNNTNFYIFLGVSPYVPQDNDDMASVLTAVTEFVAYSEATRPQFVATNYNGNFTDNTASMASYTMTSAGVISGAGLTTTATKGTNTGVLYSYSNFPAQRTVSVGDVLKVSYQTSFF